MNLSNEREFLLETDARVVTPIPIDLDGKNFLHKKIMRNFKK